jgi:hypothetical protein
MRTASVGAFALILLAACGTGSDPSTGNAPSSPESPTETTPQPTTVEEFSVTVNGGEINGRCTGAETGEPTAMYLHGNGGDGSDVAEVEDYLTDRTRVCTYDRPGAGLSDPPDDLPRPSKEVVAEAGEVLDAAGIPPPYFLIGFSQGGSLGLMFAQANPQDVTGMVLINPGPFPFTAHKEAAEKVLTPEELRTMELVDFRGENAEQIDWSDNDSMATDPLPPDLPYHILFDEDCGGDTEFCDKVLTFLPDLSRMLAEVGDGGEFTWVKGAGHDIDLTRPDVTEETINATWEEAT